MSDPGKRAAMGAAAGFGIGLWVGAAMCAVGFLACLTGVGVVVGLPLILAGVALPIFAGAQGAGRDLSPEELESLNRGSSRVANVGGFVCLLVVLVGLGWLAWVVNG